MKYTYYLTKISFYKILNYCSILILDWRKES